MSPAWYRFSADRRVLTLVLHIQPNARSTGVAGPHGDALKLRIAAPAVDGRANAALAGFIGGAFGVAASRVVLRQGASGRRKLVDIEQPPAGAEQVLAAWGGA